MRILRAITFAVLTAFTFTPAFAIELVMVEEHGCTWCERWNEEIAPIYPKTSAGKFAPLRRVDLHADLPEDLKDLDRLVFTPTFVLVQDGQEIGRIEGYPGEDFFWGILEKMLQDKTEFGKEAS